MYKNKALIILCLLASGCASRYKTYDLNSFYYGYRTIIEDSLQVRFYMNIQSTTGNKAYSNKEQKHNMSAIAIQIDNLSKETKTINQNNFKLLSIDNQITPFSTKEYVSKVRQHPGMYMLHALYGPHAFYTETDDGHVVKFHYYYIPIGALIGLHNTIRAIRANHKNERLIEENSLWNREVKPGETIRGIVIIPLIQDTRLKFSFDRNSL